ncbi:hypothetical protein PUN28_001005 [Cardiocondyla obscurior]|uniref:Uncharacterized protein n=1 Tax=Cardiocondyla obscurior TaxID=286306 RepID=A0AAW2H2Z3_9HYME
MSRSRKSTKNNYLINNKKKKKNYKKILHFLIISSSAIMIKVFKYAVRYYSLQNSYRFFEINFYLERCR